MKKVLYGTTALVAASLVTAGAASAAEKIKIAVGGYYQVAFGITDVDSPAGVDFTPTHVQMEGEIHFKGETTLDNGLTVGVNVQLEGYQSNDQIDEHYVYLKGGWGEVTLGAENAATEKMHPYAPGAGIPGHGADSPNIGYYNAITSAIAAGGSGNSAPTGSELYRVSDTNKITYFTPRFGGLQVGVSYTPDTGTGTGGNGTNVALPTLENNNVENVFSIAATYSNSFGGVSIDLAGGYETGDGNGNVNDDYDVYSLGATVGYAGFSVGGTYGNRDQNGVEVFAYGVGLNYSTGPWSLGGGWFHGENDNNGDELDVYEVGGAYNLGPGVTVGAGVYFYDDGVAGRADQDSITGVIVLGLSF